MDRLQEPATHTPPPAGRRIAGVVLIAVVLLGGSGLSALFLSGCSSAPFQRFIPFRASIYYFVCDKETKTYAVFDILGIPVVSGTFDTSTHTCLDVEDDVIDGIDPNAHSASAKSTTGQPGAQAAVAAPPPLKYMLDVGNYYAVQILNPATITFTEVDLPGGVNAAYPMSIAGTPDGTTLWVAQLAIMQNNGGVPPQPPRITIMNTASQAFTGSFNLPAAVSPITVRFSPDGTTAYVSNDGSSAEGQSGTPANSSVLVIDVASHALLKTIATPKGAGQAVLTPDGLLLYTINNNLGIGANALTVIDTTTNTVATSATLPNGAIKLFINPSGTRLYIISQFTIGVFDTATNQQVASIPTVGFAIRGTWATFSPDGQSVWFCNCGYGSFYQVDQRTNQVTQTMMRPGLGVGFMFGWTH